MFFHDCNTSTQKKYDGFANETVNVYYFNTSWCIWSKRFNNTWEQFVLACNDKYPSIVTKNIDGDENKSKCEEYKIKGFPTVIFEKNGKHITYNGPNNLTELISALDIFLLSK